MRSFHCKLILKEEWIQNDLKSWTRQLNLSAASAITLPKTNRTPKGHPKRKFHLQLPTIFFQELLLLVSERFFKAPCLISFWSTGTPINTALHFQLRAKLQVLGCWDHPKLRPENMTFSWIPYSVDVAVPLHCYFNNENTCIEAWNMQCTAYISIYFARHKQYQIRSLHKVLFCISHHRVSFYWIIVTVYIQTQLSFIDCLALHFCYGFWYANLDISYWPIAKSPLIGCAFTKGKLLYPFPYAKPFRQPVPHVCWFWAIPFAPKSDTKKWLHQIRLWREKASPRQV